MLHFSVFIPAKVESCFDSLIPPCKSSFHPVWNKENDIIDNSPFNLNLSFKVIVFRSLGFILKGDVFFGFPSSFMFITK